MNNISAIMKPYYDAISDFFQKGRLIILIMLLSSLLQVFFIINFSANPLESDAIQYNLLAKNLLHNKIFSLDGKTINLTRSPGYPFFIFIIYSLFGEKIAAVQMAQVILVALTCLFVYRIGVIIFSEDVGILAALITAVNPIFICQSFFILSEALAAFLITLSVYLAVVSIQNGKIPHFILLGVFLGAAALIKPAVLLLPFFSLFLLIFFNDWKKNLRFAIFFLIPFILIVGIWIYRDYRHTGYLIPLQIMGGRSLWTGTYVPGQGFDEHPLTIRARDELGERLSIKIKKEHGKLIEEKSSRFDVLTYLVIKEMGREGIKNIINNPIGLVKILPQKLGRLYVGSYSYLYGVREKFEEFLRPKYKIKDSLIKLLLKSGILFISILVTGCALLGAVSSCIAKTPRIFPIIVLLAYWNLMFVFLDSMTRYSIPIFPIIILMAAKGIYFAKGSAKWF